MQFTTLREYLTCSYPSGSTSAGILVLVHVSTSEATHGQDIVTRIAILTADAFRIPLARWNRNGPISIVLCMCLGYVMWETLCSDARLGAVQ